ncbi:MAG: Cysteine desulfurase, partial [uncultured Thermomicrobiales bacterium]
VDRRGLTRRHRARRRYPPRAIHPRPRRDLPQSRLLRGLSRSGLRRVPTLAAGTGAAAGRLHPAASRWPTRRGSSPPRPRPRCLGRRPRLRPECHLWAQRRRPVPRLGARGRSPDHGPRIRCPRSDLEPPLRPLGCPVRQGRHPASPHLVGRGRRDHLRGRHPGDQGDLPEPHHLPDRRDLPRGGHLSPGPGPRDHDHHRRRPRPRPTRSRPRGDRGRRLLRQLPQVALWSEGLRLPPRSPRAPGPSGGTGGELGMGRRLPDTRGPHPLPIHPPQPVAGDPRPRILPGRPGRSGLPRRKPMGRGPRPLLRDGGGRSAAGLRPDRPPFDLSADERLVPTDGGDADPHDRSGRPQAATPRRPPDRGPACALPGPVDGARLGSGVHDRGRPRRPGRRTGDPPATRL